MFKIIFVTNSNISVNIMADIKRANFKKMADYIMVREKSLNKNEYRNFIKKVLKVVPKDSVIIHTHADIAKEFKIKNIHFSLNDFLNFKDHANFSHIGVSIHSLKDALIAQNLGATNVVAGHIFATKSHENEPPKGIDFLQNIASNLKIKIYAIGGINFQNLDLIKQTGIDGACMMREFIKQTGNHNF